MAGKYNVQLTAEEIDFAYHRLIEHYSNHFRDITLAKAQYKSISGLEYSAVLDYWDHALELYEHILKAFGEIIDTINENERMKK